MKIKYHKNQFIYISLELTGTYTRKIDSLGDHEIGGVWMRLEKNLRNEARQEIPERASFNYNTKEAILCERIYKPESWNLILRSGQNYRGWTYLEDFFFSLFSRNEIKIYQGGIVFRNQEIRSLFWNTSKSNWEHRKLNL